MAMDYNSLYSLVDGASLENNSLLNYNGIEFKVQYADLTCTSEAIAFMEAKRKCRILMKENIAEDEKKLCLLHEIVEICLMQYHGYKKEGAHKIALEHEAKYISRKTANFTKLKLV